MIVAVALLLLAAAAFGVLATRADRGGRTAYVALGAVLGCAGAAAVFALAAPPASGFWLAAVRVAAVLAAMAGGGALVTTVFHVAGADRSEASSGVSTSGPGEFAETSALAESSGADPTCAPAPPIERLRGGLTIGILERAAITVCVLANFSAGLAVIVAAKGLARYPELRNPGAAEQFIIGTFVSVLWAAACAGVAVAISR